eukprot:TRINITY_DN7130_c0_g2_i1.p1 TRINITY_DN7130_c0_g2~~TRINITY_DN7130_c0_g2_i1.p1  ORF type:complete len:589 (+),score=198.72 TRINITY_DN7130_c0_g2_i1:67-1833(+)
MAAPRGGYSSASAAPPASWRVADVSLWLKRIPGICAEASERHGASFAEHRIDGAALLGLTEERMKQQLGVQSFGDRRRISRAVEELRSGRPGLAPPAPPPRSPPPAAAAAAAAAPRADFVHCCRCAEGGGECGGLRRNGAAEGEPASCAGCGGVDAEAVTPLFDVRLAGESDVCAVTFCPAEPPHDGCPACYAVFTPCGCCVDVTSLGYCTQQVVGPAGGMERDQRTGHWLPLCPLRGSGHPHDSSFVRDVAAYRLIDEATYARMLDEGRDREVVRTGGCKCPLCGAAFYPPPKLAKDRELDCAHCRRRFCRDCGVPAGITDCRHAQEHYTAKGRGEAAEKAQLLRDLQLQRCPHCGEAAQLREGCKFAYCTCGGRFCFVCGRPLEETCHYCHFTDGPFGKRCRGGGPDDKGHVAEPRCDGCAGWTMGGPACSKCSGWQGSGMELGAARAQRPDAVAVLWVDLSFDHVRPLMRRLEDQLRVSWLLATANGRAEQLFKHFGRQLLCVLTNRERGGDPEAGYRLAYALRGLWSGGEVDGVAKTSDTPMPPVVVYSRTAKEEDCRRHGVVLCRDLRAVARLVTEQKGLRVV